MSIDLKIPQAEESVIARFKLPKDVMDAFQLYVRAAQEQAPNADESLVLSTLLSHQLKKDRAFKDWLKNRSKQLDSETQKTMASEKITDFAPKEKA